MAIKIGVSGFGRISRLAIRSAMDMPEVEIAGTTIEMQTSNILHICLSMILFSDVFLRV